MKNISKQIPLYIFGAGTRAGIVVDLINWQLHRHYAVKGYFDDVVPVGTTGPGGAPVMGTIRDGLDISKRSAMAAFIALGTRVSIRSVPVLDELKKNRAIVVNIISPQAHISPSAHIGDNALIMPGVFIGSNVVLGDLITIHAGSSIEHDCRVGSNVVIGPGVSMAGKVTIESHTLIGAGSSMISNVTIAVGACIGAGSVVVSNMPPNMVCYGVPACPERATRKDDEVPTKSEIRYV